MGIGARMGCHQMPDRSFFLKGYQFPVCARCTGVVLGEFLAIIALLCGIRIYSIYAGLLVAPLVIDGGLQYVRILQSNNARRVTTGTLAGFGLTYLYYYLLLAIIIFICRAF